MYIQYVLRDDLNPGGCWMLDLYSTAGVLRMYGVPCVGYLGVSAREEIDSLTDILISTRVDMIMMMYGILYDVP